MGLFLDPQFYSIDQTTLFNLTYVLQFLYPQNKDNNSTHTPQGYNQRLTDKRYRKYRANSIVHKNTQEGYYIIISIVIFNLPTDCSLKFLIFCTS